MLVRWLTSSLFALVCLVTAGAAAEKPNAASNAPEAAKRVVVRQAANGAADKQVEQARKVLEEAQKQLAAAQKEAEETQKKVQAAQKAAAEAQRRLAEAQQRAQAAARAVGRIDNPSYAAAFPVRQTVDRMDTVERFAVLTPAGPVIVEATITIDGKPFREPREKLVDDMLALADTDRDGKPTWAEAIANSRSFVGSVRYFGNEAQRKQYLDSLDLNKDGLMDRYEARMMIAGRSGGGDFVLTASPATGLGFPEAGLPVALRGQPYNPGGGGDLRALLDADGDGVLSAKEIAGGPDRLKSRDADDNDVLEAAELAGVSATNRRTGGPAARVRLAMQTNYPLAILLGPTANWPGLFAVLKQAYGDKDGLLTAERFAALRPLFESVDANRDGQWQEEELATLNRVAPHVRLKIDLGEKGGRLEIASLGENISRPGKSDEATENVVTLPGVKLALSAAPGGQRRFDYSTAAKQMLASYDKNANGYIDKEEMPGGAATQFALWDANGDDKVYAEEITASYERQMAPVMSQVRATVWAERNSLHAALDANGDSRLGLREMRAAPDRIRSFDKNGDGQVAAEEIPLSMKVAFGLGSAGGYPYAGPSKTSAPATSAPEWFTRMDRNGDGDVTPREFLGTPEQFQKLDSNADGFLDRQEAAAAKKS